MRFRFELIRHGNTDATTNHTYCGHTDLPLNEAGIADIVENVEDGIYTLTDVYFTSGMKRANMTLKLYAGEDVKYEVREGWKECNFGIFEGYTHDELLENEYYQAWITDETGTYIPPQGESTVGFNERVDKAFTELFDEIASLGVESATMVCHGGPISRFFAVFIDDSLNMYEAMPSRGEGFSMIINYEDGKATVEEWRKVLKIRK